jgi:hypothetical protein
MSADSPELPHMGWTEADAISVWACDREAEGDATPILIAVREWERVGLRGIEILDVWAPSLGVGGSRDSKASEDLGIELGFWRNEETGSWRFAELVDSGNLRYVGRMPEMPGYPPENLPTGREPDATPPAE